MCPAGQLGKVKKFIGGGGSSILDVCVEMGMSGGILSSGRITDCIKCSK